MQGCRLEAGLFGELRFVRVQPFGISWYEQAHDVNRNEHTNADVRGLGSVSAVHGCMRGSRGRVLRFLDSSRARSSDSQLQRHQSTHERTPVPDFQLQQRICRHQYVLFYQPQVHVSGRALIAWCWGNTAVAYSQADCPYPTKYTTKWADPSDPSTLCVIPCPSPMFTDDDYDSVYGILISFSGTTTFPRT